MQSACTYSSCSHYTSAPCHQAQAHTRAHRYGYSPFQVHTEAFTMPAIFIDTRMYLSLPSERTFVVASFACVTWNHGVHTHSCITLLHPRDERGYDRIYSFITYGHTRYSARRGVEGFHKYRMLYPCNIMENQAVTVVGAIQSR